MPREMPHDNTDGDTGPVLPEPIPPRDRPRRSTGPGRRDRTHDVDSTHDGDGADSRADGPRPPRRPPRGGSARPNATHSGGTHSGGAHSTDASAARTGTTPPRGPRTPRRRPTRSAASDETPPADPTGHDHGHGHGHGHGPAEPASRRVRTLLAVLLAPFALAALVGVLVLYPWGGGDVTGHSVGEPVNGEVVSSETGPCLSPGQVQVGEPDDDGAGQQQCSTVRVTLTDGPGSGRTITKDLPSGQGNPHFAAGDEVVLAYSGSNPTDPDSYQVQDFQRGLPLALLACVFAAAVIVLGRWRGAAALVALSVTGVIIGVFVLPAILHGGNPLAIAIAGAGLIMFVALYTTHGFSARTSAAVLGTMVSLALIGVLAAIFSAGAQLTGLDENTSTLIGSLGHEIDARGLLLAGIVIGALGVLDDVTVTQASAVWELHRANPRLTWRDLYRAALRIGRAHVGSAVNTLVMAYAGAALPALLLASLSDVGLGPVLTSQEMAAEIVRTLAGSIGIIAAVPVTSLLAAVIVVREEGPRPTDDPTDDRLDHHTDHTSHR